MDYKINDSYIDGEVSENSLGESMLEDESGSFTGANTHNDRIKRLTSGLFRNNNN